MIVSAANTLVDFCALRDIDTPDDGRYDVAILFGGSILAGAEAFARTNADCRMIVGGQGHSTDALCRSTGWPDADGLTEAAIFDRYLRTEYGFRADLLEHESTNCGNNVRNALSLLTTEGVPHTRILIIQDASMQRRMDAGFRLHAPDTQVVNYAAHRTHFDAAGAFTDPPRGMWPPARYLSLLMGEIPRLTDDTNGYGPVGRGFIAHVDVPPTVADAYTALLNAGAGAPRSADQRWA
ncbi:YdcF family protein [Actinoplanes bogorensis]|uniref:YdcF family protein n=1 Tax=Paractinoplanes bogorensis TaxID=1610840 RepID=A0ABS5YK96_9ACTN|nr:ElyC/SanA/YdcF family protein [Actinoplanes bogorensis]MBU2663895.1 YdcF family protein [Actinoplanes bogorensis]